MDECDLQSEVAARESGEPACREVYLRASLVSRLIEPCRIPACADDIEIESLVDVAAYAGVEPGPPSCILRNVGGVIDRRRNEQRRVTTYETGDDPWTPCA